MKIKQEHALGAIFTLFVFLAFQISSQNKTAAPAEKKDTVIVANGVTIVIPDSTREKMRRSEQKGLKLDTLMTAVEKKIANVGKNQGSEIKRQGLALDKIRKNSPYVDTLPGPELTSKPIPFPDTIHIITKQRQSFWESLFKRKRP